MRQQFQGWPEVARLLRLQATEERDRAASGAVARLNYGQCASLYAIADRIIDQEGLIIADEVGMGKTRVAVSLTSAVVRAGGRVAILVPPVLGYQWEQELREGGAPSPQILRSLLQYFEAWSEEDPKDHRPWFEEPVVLLSHSFANWRLGASSTFWRWGMLPEVYARWRARTSESGRLPRGYHAASCDDDVRNAAISVVNAIPQDQQETSWQIVSALVEQTPWPEALNAEAYTRDGKRRSGLETAVGLGLGLFDLVVIDEAHKSRGEDSRLSVLLDGIVMSTSEVRRFGMTATPVELDALQWSGTLSRIGLKPKQLEPLKKDIEAYADIVRKLRLCPTSDPLRERFKSIARQFEETLSRYVLRRDKREDDAVRRFAAAAGEMGADYRVLHDIVIDATDLSPTWQQAICAAESLSLAGRGGVGINAEQQKRLRLTFGNGHGLAAMLNAPLMDDDADEGDDSDKTPLVSQAKEMFGEKEWRCASKREERVRWWAQLMQAPFAKQNGDQALFGHPAILATVDAIEDVLARDEKVLVFGRFTRPLRRLTELLNARSMLKALEAGTPWPQEKVHGDPSANADQSDWPAVRAAHEQLKCKIPLGDIDARLKKNYAELQSKRERFRASLLSTLDQGFACMNPEHDNARLRARILFDAFREDVLTESQQGRDSHTLSLISRAIEDIVSLRHSEKPEPTAFAEAFAALTKALSDRNEGDDDGDGALDEDEASELWHVLRQRLEDDYSTVRGGMARLMYGGTSQHSRRMMQLAFNRLHSPTRVLVAQSAVGREGLNLHLACRTVVLLHPEWNPGVVEQQIGRVDRVGSFWQQCLYEALHRGVSGGLLPRIEIRPVVFRGTYDEYNWQVLSDRWRDLRAQLHGMVLTVDASSDEFMRKIICSINDEAPNFSPSRLRGGSSALYEQG